MKRFIGVFIGAVIVGIMFRFADILNLSLMRMFATQGIVVVGFLAARALKKTQTDEGVRQVTEALEALPDSVKVIERTNNGKQPVWIVENGGQSYVIGGSDLPQTASVGRAARTVLKESEDLQSYARQKGFDSKDRPVHSVLVLLRRKLAAQGVCAETTNPDFPITLVNPEGIHQLFDAEA